MYDVSQALADRVASSFAQLNSTAADLNAVSDELGKYVSQIDNALKRLNLGIAVWVTVWSWSGDRQDENNFGTQDLGYAKVAGKWGICLRKVEGNQRDPDEADVEAWPFSDAPRSLRLDSITHIPKLIDKLSIEAVKATAKIKEKLADVQAVAVAMNPPPFRQRPVTTVTSVPAQVWIPLSKAISTPWRKYMQRQHAGL